MLNIQTKSINITNLLLFTKSHKLQKVKRNIDKSGLIKEKKKKIGIRTVRDLI